MVDGEGVEARLGVRDTCAPYCGDETAKDWPTSVLSWRLGTRDPVDTAGARPESVPLASAASPAISRGVEVEDDSEPEAMSSSATKASYEGSQVRENTQKERRKKEKKKL